MVAAGNLGVVAISINMGTFKVFMEILPTSPRTILVAVTAIISLIIGVVLSTSITLGKKSLLTALITSVVIYVIAAVQVSIILLFVLWPWSLYKLYRSEIA